MPRKIFDVLPLLVIPHLDRVVCTPRSKGDSVLEVFQRNDTGGVSRESFKRAERRAFF